MKELREVKPGQPVSAELFNNLIAEVRRLGKIVPGPGLNLSSNAAGVQISLASLQRLPLLGKTDEEITKGGAGTVSIWAGTPGAEADTGLTEEAQSPFGTVLISKWVWLSHNGHGWYIAAAECD